MEEPEGNWYSWSSVRVTSGQRVDGRGEKGPGVSCCLEFPRVQEEPTILSPLGEGPTSSRQADIPLMDSRSPGAETVQSCWDLHCVQLGTITDSLLPANKPLSS